MIITPILIAFVAGAFIGGVLFVIAIILAKILGVLNSIHDTLWQIQGWWIEQINRRY